VAPPRNMTASVRAPHRWHKISAIAGIDVRPPKSCIPPTRSPTPVRGTRRQRISQFPQNYSPPLTAGTCQASETKRPRRRPRPLPIPGLCPLDPVNRPAADASGRGGHGSRHGEPATSEFAANCDLTGRTNATGRSPRDRIPAAHRRRLGNYTSRFGSQYPNWQSVPDPLVAATIAIPHFGDRCVSGGSAGGTRRRRRGPGRTIGTCRRTPAQRAA
jgi:hypothetical protein